MRSLLMLLILMSIVVLARGQCPTDGKKFIPAVSMEVNTHPGFLVQAGIVGLQQPFSVFFGIEGKANEQPDKTGMKDDNPKSISQAGNPVSYYSRLTRLRRP